jgi:hypothetical protein
MKNLVLIVVVALGMAGCRTDPPPVVTPPTADAYVTVPTPNPDAPDKTVKLPLRKVGNDYVYQGDILFNPDPLAVQGSSVRGSSVQGSSTQNLHAQSNRLKNLYCEWTFLVYAGCHGLWPNNTLFYAFDSNVPQSLQNTVKQAATVFFNRTGIVFSPSSSASNRVQIHVLPSTDLRGGSSYVGMKGGEQDMKFQANASLGVVLHEFGHALGLWHEQGRADRDQHIQVLENNIVSDERSQYKLLDDPDMAQLSGPYDYKSIMHYPAYNSFSVKDGNGKELPQFNLVNPPAGLKLSDVGNQTDLTAGDALALGQMYNGQVADGSIKLLLNSSPDLIAGEARDLTVGIGNAGPTDMGGLYLSMESDRLVKFTNSSSLKCAPNPAYSGLLGVPIKCAALPGPKAETSIKPGPIQALTALTLPSGPLTISLGFIPTAGTRLADPSKGFSKVVLNVTQLSPDGYEVNDTPQQAKTINLGEQLLPTNLHVLEDVDCFRFNAPDASNAKAYMLEVQGTDSPLPLHLKLFDAADLGTIKLAQDGNINPITLPGSYVVCVNGDARTRYDLRLGTTDLDRVKSTILGKLNVRVVEHIAPGTPVYGQLIESSLFLLPPTTGGKVTVTGTNLRVALVDENLNVLAEATTIPGINGLQLSVPDVPGRFVRLTRAQEDVTNGNLTLHNPIVPFQVSMQ